MDFLFDNTLDTTNVRNVILIDKDTLDYEVFYNSCNETTFPIVYSKTCSRDDLLQLLNNKFTNIDRLCFIFSFKPAYEFLNNELLFRDDESIPYSENVTFIINLINQFNISTVDYLACNTLNYENWQNYYNVILSNTTASVGASNDFTGNLKYGGDWTMESTGQDIEIIYFNSEIQNYQYLLGEGPGRTILIMNNNTLYGCGANDAGQLGTNENSHRNSLTMMVNTNINGKTPILVTGGINHTVVLMSDGTIYGTGRTSNGELGFFSASDIRVLTLIPNSTGKTPVSIKAGAQHTVVLMSDGTIYGTGFNTNGQLGLNDTSNRSSLTLIPNSTGKTPKSICCGQYTTIVLMTDNSIYGTGYNFKGELGIGNTTQKNTLTLMTAVAGKTPVSIAGGHYFTIVLMSDGTIYGTGFNLYGQLGTGNTTDRSTLTLMSNSTGKTPKQVDCGSIHTTVLMTDNTLYATGWNGEAPLGVGDTTDRSTLTLMPNTTGKTPSMIFAGEIHTIVLMSDNAVYGCGRNYFGELGLGNNITPKTTLTQMVNSTGQTPKTVMDTPVKLNPTITGFSIPTKTYGNSPFTITQPTSNSSGSFSYSSSNTSVATISGSTITIVGAGTATITATQAATDNFNSGTATASFQVLNASSPPTITGFSIPTKTYGDTSFTITQPTSNSSGSFSYSSSNTSVATISGSTITIVGAGTATITATQAATASYTSGTATASFQVNKANPTITGFSVPTKTYGDSAFTITQPTSNSSGSFSYSSSNTSVATISGNTITIVGAGGYGISTITATQAATSNYNSGTITALFQVNKATPIITGFSIPTKTYGDNAFTITQPTSTSTREFTYTSSDESVATISGSTITIVSAGTATITAYQETTADYDSGTITASFQVNKANPSINNFSVSTKTYGDSDFIITPPTSTSTGAFTYTSSDESVATISGNIITIVGIGTTTITVTQAETTNYNSGTITASLQVAKANPSITGFSVPTKTYGDTSFMITSPTSNSTGAFSYSSSDESVATISGNTITIVGAGTATITANQVETTDYSSGTTTASFQVTKATPSISGFSVPTKTYGDSSFTITQPTSNSNGAFSYSSSNTLVATISGNTITIVGPGISTITATQGESTNFTSGTQTASFQVANTSPSLSGFSIPKKRYGTSPFIISPPTSNSGGSFSYSSSNTSVATVSGNIITMVGSGTSTITATQSETTNYSSGIITTSFQVDKAIPSISGFSIPTKTYGDSPFTITQPSSNSNGAFSYSSSNTSVATISGNTITIVGTGISNITATQAETSNYISGTIIESFQVTKVISTPSISGFSIPTKTYGDSSFTITQPSSNSDGSFSYISSDYSVATISGNTITIVGAGTVNIIAIQEKTSIYTSGSISTSFQVDKATPSISGFSIPTKTYGDSPFTITQPTSNSIGTFSYLSSDSSIASISGNTITILGAGTVVILAIQEKTSNYTSGVISTELVIL